MDTLPDADRPEVFPGLIRLDEDRVRSHVDRVIRESVEKTLNGLLKVEGAKEDAESWRQFLRHLKARGLAGVRLVVADKCLGLVEAVGECFPEARWQRCEVYFYRNVFTAAPTGKAREVAAMLKAIHAQKDPEAAEAKAAEVVEKLASMRLARAAEVVRSGVSETLAYMAFPKEHWTRLRTNNSLERLMREIRHRTRVVGSLPDGALAVLLVAAR